MIKYIYTFFVGLFLAIFVGLGIAVFYEAPTAPDEPSWYRTAVEVDKQSEADKAEEQAYMTARDEYEDKMLNYNRNVSVIVLVCAVVILAVSLIFKDRLGVVADGLLLGGIFTLLYGIFRGMDTGSNTYRFLIATTGLVVTLVLGYIKFTRQQSSTESKAGKTSKGR